MARDTFVCFTDKWDDPVWLDAAQVEAIQIIEDDKGKQNLTVIIMRSGYRYKVKDTLDTVIRDIRSVIRLGA